MLFDIALVRPGQQVQCRLRIIAMCFEIHPQSNRVVKGRYSAGYVLMVGCLLRGLHSLKNNKPSYSSQYGVGYFSAFSSL